jgi:hypothetical protein
MALVAGKPIKARRVRDPIAERHSAALEGLSACPVDQTAPSPLLLRQPYRAFKATTTRSNITRTDIPSCLPVWTGEPDEIHQDAEVPEPSQERRSTLTQSSQVLSLCR